MRGIYISDHARRQINETNLVVKKKQRIKPSNLSDPLANWVPAAEANPDDDDNRGDFYDAEDGGEQSTGDALTSKTVLCSTTENEKRKRYLSSVS